jgi:hypothetical protein
LNDKSLRGTLLKDAVYDALRTTAPFKFFAGIAKHRDR